MKKLLNIAVISVAFIGAGSSAEARMIEEFDAAVVTCNEAFKTAHDIANEIASGDKELAKKCRKAYKPAQTSCDEAMAAFRKQLV